MLDGEEVCTTYRIGLQLSSGVSVGAHGSTKTPLLTSGARGGMNPRTRLLWAGVRPGWVVSRQRRAGNGNRPLSSRVWWRGVCGTSLFVAQVVGGVAR
jgi:hypothetical protein